MRLTQIIEALLFASDAPLSAADLSRVDERLDEDTVEAVIQELRADYEQGERSFQIYEVAGGYQLLTRPEFVSVLERYDSVPQPSRLSAPALEVLAIIAYRQPMGRIEIEDIRGVGSSGVLRTLTERGLVEPVARGEGMGRPLLYGTTRKFLEHFGFRSLEDLPRPDELPIVLRERPAPAAEDQEGAVGVGSEPASSADAAPGAAGTDAAAVGLDVSADAETTGVTADAGPGDAPPADATAGGDAPSADPLFDSAVDGAAPADTLDPPSANAAPVEPAPGDGAPAGAGIEGAGEPRGPARSAGAEPDDAAGDSTIDIAPGAADAAEVREGVRG